MAPRITSGMPCGGGPYSIGAARPRRSSGTWLCSQIPKDPIIVVLAAHQDNESPESAIALSRQLQMLPKEHLEPPDVAAAVCGGPEGHQFLRAPGHVRIQGCEALEDRQNHLLEGDDHLLLLRLGLLGRPPGGLFQFLLFTLFHDGSLSFLGLFMTCPGLIMGVKPPLYTRLLGHIEGASARARGHIRWVPRHTRICPLCPIMGRGMVSGRGPPAQGSMDIHSLGMGRDIYRYAPPSPDTYSPLIMAR